MASKSGQKVRLVKCPKCFKILQEYEDVPVYQCGGCSTILQAKRRTIAPNITPSEEGAEVAQASEPGEGGTEGAQASEPPETNNVSSSSEQDTVLPPPTDRSTGKVDEKARDGSLESTENQLGGSIREERNENQLQERSLDDSDKNEGEDNSRRLKSDIKLVVQAMEPGTTSSGSLNADHVVDDARASDSSSDAYRKLEAGTSPDASPVEEEQNEDDYFFNGHRESTDDNPANKTCSTYDESESSSDEREDELLDENEQWEALQEISSGKFQMQRYPENFKEQRRGSSSSATTFSDKRPNVTTTTTYMERYQNRSLQLEGPGGRLGRQGRNHMTRPNIPFYPREPYTRVSPSYPSQDEFDRHSRAHSLQMPPYESADHMYHNITRARGRGQGSRFSGEMTNDRRNHPGWYSGQLHSSYSSYPASPQRPMEQQPAYYPRWSHEIVSDAEDRQRDRHAGGHHHDLQARRLRERQRLAKRHIRPTAGGAPFVSCYSCSENLQLPVDFLIFKRKYHLLRCGRCTTVLRFSLESRTHLVPAVKHDINASNSILESPRDKAPFKPPEKPNSSAQEEEIPVARGSPLHRLMGYSTVSQVFKASQRPPSL
ncbi:Uncharacterized protein Rs2_33553 [Raphanus sativus]|uniref:Protein ENHANCED DISEASE RESISTANCE 4 n=1 Tax=Raphanus sativus TaxID=3726 RepID=A0A6J0KFG3_RAPSA|nr:protein ENHANCED DISEASE RESISTANCE 4 [Raphanus sativus]KAJ4883460.1 Uncharacterized protein Rs2_33553 [Raphanus sativus]